MKNLINAFFIISLILVLLVSTLNAQDFWEQTNGPLGGNVFSLAIISTGHILAGTESGGVFRSTDNGDSWTEINTGLPAAIVFSFAINSSGHIFAGTQGGVYRSMDNGDSWTERRSGLTDAVVRSVAINSSGHIFAGTQGGVFRSTDNADSWTEINTGMTAAVVYSFAINSSGDIFAGTLDGVFRSPDNGDTWTEINNGLTNKTVWSLAINSSGDIFAATDAGMLRSPDNGDTWTEINSGLTSPNISSLNISSLAINSRGDIFAGTQGFLTEGAFRSSDNGDSWTKINNGLTNLDVGSLAINSTGHIFAGTRGSGVFRSLGPTTNYPPFVTNPILDVVADEDFGSIMVAPLNSIFDDLDLPNDSLRYTVSVSSGLITGSISGDILWLFSVVDSNGMAEVVVTATDDSSASVSDTFMVTVNPPQKADRIIGAVLLGENSVPPVTSSATGTLTGVLTNDWTELHYSITIEGLTPTVAHFHNGAFDETGGVVKAVDFSGEMTISGVWSSSDGTQPFTTEMLNELLAGRIYVNIHTSANPGGEIRGNIEIAIFFKANLSGDKIVPTPVTSSGVGTGGSILFGYEREFEYVLNVTGLTPTVAHFHGGSATETGGVLKDITFFDGHMAFGNWLGDDAQSLTDSLITELLLGNIYMNIHTSANPGGEIRSQLKREDATWFLAFMIDEHQVPPTGSISNGIAILTLNSAKTQVEYDITISQITPTAAHFHNAGAGLTGGIVKTLDFVNGHASGVWSASDGSQPLTPELVEELLSGRLYVNIHTTALPAGEIRGQIQTFSGFSAQLSGSQSIPSVATSGTGTMTSKFFYEDSGAELEYNITVEGLAITAAHFHAGAAGESGGVIKTITFDGNSAEGIWTANDAQPLTDEIVDMIRSGGVYVNIHTAANPAGEIRGQLLPGIIEVPIGVVDEDVAQLPTNVQLKQNFPNPFNPITTIDYSLSSRSEVSLIIFDVRGREVVGLVDEEKQAGLHSARWDASNVSSGIYFYRLQAGDFVQTRKMVLLK